MSIFLRADNRNLFKDAPFSFLLDNYPSSVDTIKVANTTGFLRNSYVALGNIGSENTEIVQLDKVDPATGELFLVYYNGNIVKMEQNGAQIFITTDKPHYLNPGDSVTIDNTVSYNGTYTCVSSAYHNANTFVITATFTTAQTGLWISSKRTKTLHAHSESSRATVIGYNTVKFFHTDRPNVPVATPVTSLRTKQSSFLTETKTETLSNSGTTTFTKDTDPNYTQTVDLTPPIVFEGATPITNNLVINVSDFYTTFADDGHYTGYGWFAFFNTTTRTFSPISNPIPYGGFAANTVKAIFDSFDSGLNNKEIKLITSSDRFAWANEAYSELVNKLNWGNWEYNSTRELTMNIKGGQHEYLLPDDFSSLLYLTDSAGWKIEAYEATFQRPHMTTKMRYYLAGQYLCFDPKPETDTTVTLEYLKSAGVLSQLSDIVSLPNRAYYYIKDFMLFRAYMKLDNPAKANTFLTLFNKNIETMQISAVKRDDGLDSWSIAPSANV